MPTCSSRTVTLALVTTDSYVIDALAPGSVPGAGQACEGQGRWLFVGRWEVGGGQTQPQGEGIVWQVQPALESIYSSHTWVSGALLEPEGGLVQS